MAKLGGEETRTRKYETFKGCWKIAKLDGDETRTRKMLLEDDEAGRGRNATSWCNYPTQQCALAKKLHETIVRA